MEQCNFGAAGSATILRSTSERLALRAPRTLWKTQCRNAAGELQWEREDTNLVFDAGINDLLDKYFKGAAYSAAWYVGLVTNPATYDAADTMASHAGWTEDTGYSDATRRTLTLGAVAGKSVDNSASAAVFNANATSTVDGFFLCTNNVKGGTTGVLYCATQFSVGAKPLTNGDVLSVTVTLTGA